MDEVEFLGIRVPEELAGFVLVCTLESLRLEIGVGLPVQTVAYRDGRGLIQGHQFG